MKVSMGTVEMTDEQRKQLADVLDGKVSSRKATRDEARDFIWSYGKSWAETLEDMINGEANASDAETDTEDDDLIGDTSELDDLL